MRTEPHDRVIVGLAFLLFFLLVMLSFCAEAEPVKITAIGNFCGPKDQCVPPPEAEFLIFQKPFNVPVKFAAEVPHSTGSKVMVWHWTKIGDTSGKVLMQTQRFTLPRPPRVTAPKN
jgi:hypothetical protein